ncbi:hypothetical protein FGADI_4109 [Fusarium gaditjirri]|uniref:Uncharacterized protein n=1 Tax=Fusarium gaditjirri TaxID=282569 RepID=A0A8H4TE29_9HYPO|nr:hypothetical protein FGADI_4109 [Fusarium gaditjirri]
MLWIPDYSGEINKGGVLSSGSHVSKPQANNNSTNTNTNINTSSSSSSNNNNNNNNDDDDDDDDDSNNNSNSNSSSSGSYPNTKALPKAAEVGAAPGAIETGAVYETLKYPDTEMIGKFINGPGIARWLVLKAVNT